MSEQGQYLAFIHTYVLLNRQPPAEADFQRFFCVTGDREISVFDELLLLQPSTFATWKVSATCQTPDERDALVALFDDADGAFEDWTESLEILCSQCSLGAPHEHHDAKKDSAWRVDRELGLAIRDERDLGKLRKLGLWWRRGIRDVTRVL